MPSERVNTIVDLAPDACLQCERRVDARHEVGDARRHQVTELPTIEAHITESLSPPAVSPLPAMYGFDSRPASARRLRIEEPLRALPLRADKAAEDGDFPVLTPEDAKAMTMKSMTEP